MNQFPSAVHFPPSSPLLGGHTKTNASLNIASSQVENDQTDVNPPLSDKSQSSTLTQNGPQFDQVDNLPCPAPRRRGRGRGRPKKGDGHSKTSKPPRQSSSRAYHREVHNASATKSRAKFSNALADLWNQVPEKMQWQALGEDISRQIPRAEKVEIVISYIQSLETTIQDESIWDE